MAVDQQEVSKRLAITKERYRVIIERLWKSIDCKRDYINEGVGMPKNDEVTLKWP